MSSLFGATAATPNPTAAPTPAASSLFSAPSTAAANSAASPFTGGLFGSSGNSLFGSINTAGSTAPAKGGLFNFAPAGATAASSGNSSTSLFGVAAGSSSGVGGSLFGGGGLFSVADNKTAATSDSSTRAASGPSTILLSGGSGTTATGGSLFNAATNKSSLFTASGKAADTSAPATSTATTEPSGLFGTLSGGGSALGTGSSLFNSTTAASSSLFGSSSTTSTAQQIKAAAPAGKPASSDVQQQLQTPSSLFGFATPVAPTAAASCADGAPSSTVEAAPSTPVTKTGSTLVGTSTTSSGVFGSSAAAPLFSSGSGSTNAAKTVNSSAATTEVNSSSSSNQSAGATTHLFGSSSCAPATPAALGPTQATADTAAAGAKPTSSAVAVPTSTKPVNLADTTSVFGSSGSGTLFGKTTTDPASNKVVGAETSQSAVAQQQQQREATAALPSPQQLALDTLQHELVEEVLAAWERRLEKRVQQFTAAAEDVMTIERAMIAESKKIQQLAGDQVKLEGKQAYVSSLLDTLETQQRDLLTLLQSVEGALLDLHAGNTCSASSALGVDQQSSNFTSALLNEEALASGDNTTLTAAVARPSHALLSSSEQLASEQLQNLDAQLDEVSQVLSFTAEKFQAGPIGALAQVLAVHQGALQAAVAQASHIDRRVQQLQELLVDITSGSGTLVEKK